MCEESRGEDLGAFSLANWSLRATTV